MPTAGKNGGVDGDMRRKGGREGVHIRTREQEKERREGGRNDMEFHNKQYKVLRETKDNAQK